MLYKNLGYRTGCIEDIAGVMLLPSGINREYLKSRINDNKYGDRKMLFDPQLYLTELIEEEESDNIVFPRLTTYPWFAESENYNSDRYQNMTEWFNEHKENYSWPDSLPNSEAKINQNIKQCLDFQKEINVSKYILPVPIIKNAEDGFTEQLKWIKNALELKPEYNGEFLASLTIDDSILLQSDFDDNTVLQTILDNISTLSSLDGIYLVILRNKYDTLYQISPRVASSLLEISYLIGVKSKKQVIINFEDVYGLVCMGVGADGFATGYSTSKRKMSFTNFKSSFGRSFPKFYSHNLIGDFLSETDLNKIRDNNLIQMIEDDKTSMSEGLFAALKQNQSAASVTGWRETQNNTTTAENNRMQRINKAVETINDKDALTKKVDFIKNWLLSADMKRTYFSERFEDDPLSDESRHVRVWRKVFEDFLDKYNL